jgi:hypothetical protein
MLSWPINGTARQNLAELADTAKMRPHGTDGTLDTVA